MCCPQLCAGRQCVRFRRLLRLYWKGWIALVGSITFWSGAWDITDAYAKPFFTSALSISPFYCDLAITLFGALMLVTTGTFVSSSGLRDAPPIQVSDSCCGQVYATVSSLFSLFGQVWLGLGIYNMFDLYMFEESVWWNMVCVLLGLFLLLVTKSIFVNSGLNEEAAALVGPLSRRRQGQKADTWCSKTSLASRAFLGIVGAFVMWKGWEQTLDLSMGMGEVVWREVLYIMLGFAILLLTRTFVNVSGIDDEPTTTLAPLPRDVHINPQGYTIRGSSSGSVSSSPNAHAMDFAVEFHSSRENTIHVHPYVPSNMGPSLRSMVSASPSPSPHVAHSASPDATMASTEPLSAVPARRSSSDPLAAAQVYHSPLRHRAESDPDMESLLQSQHASSPSVSPHPHFFSLTETTLRPPSLPERSYLTSPAALHTTPDRQLSRASSIDRQGSSSLMRFSARAEAYSALDQQEKWKFTWRWLINESKIYIRSSLAYVGVITMWTGVWNLQIAKVPDAWYRDFLYIVVGLIVLYVTDTLYSNASLSPMNWGGSKSSAILDDAFGVDVSSPHHTSAETELLRTHHPNGTAAINTNAHTTVGGVDHDEYKYESSSSSLHLGGVGVESEASASPELHRGGALEPPSGRQWFSKNKGGYVQLQEQQMLGVDQDNELV